MAGLRTKALSNMVDYANLQKTKPKADQGWFCDIGEYDENDVVLVEYFSFHRRDATRFFAKS